MAGFNILDQYSNKRKVSSIAAATLHRNKSDNSNINNNSNSINTTSMKITTLSAPKILPPRNNSHNIKSGIRNNNMDRLQQQNHQGASDSASVASTVKISNVAIGNGGILTSSPSKIGINNTTQLRLPIGLISVVQSQQQRQNNKAASTTIVGGSDLHDLLTAPTIGSTTTDATNSANNSELFLLRLLELLSPNDYLRVVTDRNFISPSLQIQLVGTNGDRSQPITTPSRLNSIWYQLSNHDYQCISNSVLYHMRMVAKRKSSNKSFNVIKKGWTSLWDGCRRNTSAVTQTDPATSSTSSSVESPSTPPPPSNPINRTVADSAISDQHPEDEIDGSSTVSESQQEHLELLQTVPMVASSLSSLSMSSSTSGRLEQQQHSLTLQRQQQQQQQQQQQSQMLPHDDPMHLLNEILDNASDSSYIFDGGYTTTTFITSSSVDSRYKNSSSNNNPNNRRPPPAINNNNNSNRMNYTRNNGSTTSSITSASSLSTYNNHMDPSSQSRRQQYNNRKSTTTSTDRNYIHTNTNHHDSDHNNNNDNDSTTSSSYVSIASGASTNSNTNDHISISGSVASV